MKLVEKLFDNNLHIIGDIHGEYQALKNLLYHLGYDSQGNHPDNYKLVFIGDLVDRGPDSPEVLKLVKKLVENGNAQAIIGNHELNILNGKPRDGAGWFFDEQINADKNYHPFNRISSKEREMVIEFLSSLPLALENENLRLVHAAWDDAHIKTLKDVDSKDIVSFYSEIEDKIDYDIKKSGLLELYRKDKSNWDEKIFDPLSKNLPYLDSIAKYDLQHQLNNPIRVLTSGMEQNAKVPFFAGGKWRFVERCVWWDYYNHDTPVVVGHFWRKLVDSVKSVQDKENIFNNISSTSWHGLRSNVFCVDYSVGARFLERMKNLELGSTTKLVALSWPNQELILETGEVLKTSNFLNQNPSFINRNKI